MASFFNALGSSTVTGTSGRDYFYAFTRDDKFDRVRPDAVIDAFSWTTGVRTADGGFWVLNAVNVQISQDIFFTNGGVDVLLGSDRNDAIFFNNGEFANGVGGINGIQQFYLGKGDDIADMSAQGNGAAYTLKVLLNGEDGNDTLIGGSYDDTINGGNDNDLLIGNGGADVLNGGAGDDLLYGDDLNANLVGGRDTLRGGTGNDTLYGGVSADTLYGDEDDDALYGGLSGDVLFGGTGDDVIYGDDPGGSGGDKLFGDAGNDVLYGVGGIDQLDGGTGDDVLDGGDGDDILRGRADSDRLIGGAGNDSINGDDGIDTAVYFGNRASYTTVLLASGGYQVTDTRAGAPDGSDSLFNVEFVEFSDMTLSIDNLNYPPVITSNGGGISAVLSLLENTTAITTVTATDQDNGQALSFGIAGGDDSALFGIDTQTGALAFTVAPDYENAIDLDHDGTYDVVVSVVDALGGVDTQQLSITVVDTPDGAAPVISSDGGGRTASTATPENSTAVTTIVAVDPDGTLPAYRIVGGVDAARFMVDTVSGSLSFVTAPDFEAPIDANGDNVYEVAVEATDGVNSDRQYLAVEVTNGNDNPPVITSPATAVVDENTLAVMTITADDADASTPLFRPTFAITGGADAALFALDAETGILNFGSAPDFEAPEDEGADNIYNIIVTASDGAATSSRAVTITVNNLNDTAPVITSNGGGPTATLALTENTRVIASLAATDADGTLPTWRLAGGTDAALFEIDAATGALSFLSAPDFEAPQDANLDNSYEVTVEALDGLNTDAQALTIAVTDVNEIGRTIIGTSANNVITPTAVAALRTTAFNDAISGLAGDDTIDGGAGEDYMEGGPGNDTYFVDTFSDDGRSTNDDIVVELPGGGIDRVNVSVTYRLPDEVENLTQLGVADIDGFGNALNNQVIGNAGANLLAGEGGDDTILGNDGNDTISGGDGNDLLVGGTGNDAIVGGAGNDKLDGGTGADVMSGGAGDDVYIVDQYSDDGDTANDDIVIEMVGEGNDSVSASVSWKLPDNIEILAFTVTGDVDGTGNALGNTITGTNGNNILLGLDGNDTLRGLGGDDMLEGGNGSDVLDGGAGNDTLRGGVATDTLRGGDGNDLLVGGTGRDTMTGGVGSDTFAFVFGDTAMTTSLDVITDFRSSEGDLIDLDLFAGPPAPGDYLAGAVGSNSFSAALTAAQALVTAGSQIVFIAGPTDGWLFWDGAGANSVLDQAIMLTGVNSVDLFSPLSII